MGNGKSWKISAMDWHPVQREGKYSQSFSAKETVYKHWPGGPRGFGTEFTVLFTTGFFQIKSLSTWDLS